MGKTKYAVELLFGIGFKMGLLVALISVIMILMPLIELNSILLLRYLGVYYLLDQNPKWVSVLFGGVLLMVAAILISILQTWFAPLIDVLFYEDQLKPKQF